MKITKISLKDFKPMAYAGTSSLDITLDAPVLCFIGNNGSGKSTIMGEITPLPATSTMYGKKGLKRVEIRHDGSNYICESAFDGKKGEHSFIKDAVELNKSKTSGVQQELCVSEFGLTTAVSTITSGVINICSMSRSERKRFLLSCYPSDLSFVLQHHKRISSQVRATKSNLKMLNGRLVDLEHMNIPDAAFGDMMAKQQAFDDLGVDIQKTIATYDAELLRIRADPRFDETASLEKVSEYVKTIKATKRSAMAIRIGDPNLFNENIMLLLGELNAEIAHINTNVDNISIRAQEMVTEINRLKELSETVSEERVNNHIVEINNMVEQTNRLKVDATLPVLEVGDIRRINLTLLQECCVSMGHIDNLLLPREYAAVVSDLRWVNQTISDHELHIDRLTEQADKVRLNITNIKASGFREGCVLSCSARDEYESVVISMENELGSITRGIAEHVKDAASHKLSQEQFSGVVSANTDIQSWVVKVLDMVTPIQTQIATVSDKAITELVKVSPIQLYNIISRLVNNSAVVHKLSEVENDLHNEKELLDALLDARKDNRELLEDISSTKHNSLEKLRREHDELVTERLRTTDTLASCHTLISCQESLTGLSKDYDNIVVALVLKEKAALICDITNKLQASLQSLTHERYILTELINENCSIRIRINDEIKPSLEKHGEELRSLMLLEQALSPANGLPHVYMVRFINQVIEYANLATAMVWNYDMELVKFSENIAMDYSVGIKIQGSKPLKDISMLSTGQGEMVDLAFTLALFHVMGLGELYPIKLDEIDAGMVPEHRSKLLGLFDTLLNSGSINQLLLVSHATSLFTAFSDSQIACLSTEGIVVPATYNRNVTIT